MVGLANEGTVELELLAFALVLVDGAWPGSWDRSRTGLPNRRPCLAEGGA